MKYCIKNISGDCLSNKLTFNKKFEDAMIFDNAGEAKEAIAMYGLDNCVVRPCTIK